MGANLYAAISGPGDVRKTYFVDPTSTAATKIIDKYPGKGNTPLRNDIKVFRLSEMLKEYAFTEDFKIARLYRDIRVGTIIGGTSEIMLEIIAKMTIDKVNYQSKSDKTISSN